MRIKNAAKNIGLCEGCGTIRIEIADISTSVSPKVIIKTTLRKNRRPSIGGFFFFSIKFKGNVVKKISTQLLTVLTKCGIVCVETRKGLLRTRPRGLLFKSQKSKSQ